MRLLWLEAVGAVGAVEADVQPWPCVVRKAASGVRLCEASSKDGLGEVAIDEFDEA